MTKEDIKTIIELFISWNGETEVIDVANLDSAVDYISECLINQEQKTMNKVESFIKKHIRNFSNSKSLCSNINSFEQWLSPEEAREAAKIAREEVIEEVLSIIDNHLGYLEISGGMSLNYKDCIEEIKEIQI